MGSIVRASPVSICYTRPGLLKQLLPVFKLGGGGPLAGRDQYMPWIHIDDEVALILWALDTVDISGPSTPPRPTPVTNRTFSKLLGKVLKRPAYFPAPKFAVTAMRGSEVADFVTASLRVMPRRALDKGYTFRFPELEPALRDLLGKRSTRCQVNLAPVERSTRRWRLAPRGVRPSGLATVEGPQQSPRPLPPYRPARRTWSARSSVCRRRSRRVPSQSP